MSTASGDAPALSGSAAKLTVALCFGVMVIEGFDIQAVGVSISRIVSDLQLQPQAQGQVMAASNVGLVFGAIAGGWLADVFGRKPVLIASVVIFGVFTLMTMYSNSFEMLFAARLLTGLGFGGALPNVMAIAADVSSTSRRGSTAAMMFCGMPVGGSIVALLSWLGHQGDWRTLFLIGGVIPLIMAPALMLLMKETQKPERKPFDAKAMLPWLVAIPLGGAFWLALDVAGQAPGAGSIGGIISPWLGGVLALLVAYMIAHRTPLFGGGRASASVLLWITFFPTLVILYLVLNWLPTLVTDKGFAADANLASVLFNLFSVVGALCFGPLVDRFGLRWPITIGFLMLIGVLIGLGLATDIVTIMVLSGALGFFLLGCNYALYGAAAAYYPPDMRGRGSGAAIAWGRLGSVVGPLIGGYLRQGGAGPGEVVYAMAPFALLAAAGVFVLSFAGSKRG
jgi:AAHS family 3-hydroxyphenylpropionic acid transporter